MLEVLDYTGMLMSQLLNVEAADVRPFPVVLGDLPVLYNMLKINTKL